MSTKLAGIVLSMLSETFYATQCSKSVGLNEESKYTKVVCAIACRSALAGEHTIEKGDLLILMNHMLKMTIVGVGYVIGYLINGQH